MGSRLRGSKRGESPPSQSSPIKGEEVRRRWIPAFAGMTKRVEVRGREGW